MPSRDESVVNAVRKVEAEIGHAMIRHDVYMLSRLYADDFKTITSSGAIITKRDILDDFSSFRDEVASFENGPVDVQVFGNVAVAHAAVREKRSLDGKEVGGEFVWMNLLKKREGRWVVVRSAGARVK